ncbi:MAG: LysE family transporter, partial [Thermoprotei archaeon]|nr:LysE family transporter [Thermoprotei archaeon]
GLSGGFAVSGSLEAVAVGVALTGFNVYFLAWWLTVGYPLVEESSKLGFKGFTAMYVSHIWMDYAWLTILAAGGGATKILGETPYAALLAVLALILTAFALKIAADTLKLIKMKGGQTLSNPVNS